MGNAQAASLLRELFEAAVAAAQPARCLLEHLPEPAGNTIVIGAGKASAAMARTLEQHWRKPLSGIVLTPYGHGVPCEQIEIVEAGHPVPDESGMAGARRILDRVSGLGAEDLVVALISGGGSALLTLPPPGVLLQEKQDVNAALLRSGAAISEMNCVRKHLSAIKGGRLAAAVYPARLVTLLVSDVPGDDPAVIASGPTVADDTTAGQAREIIERYRIPLSSALQAFVQSDAAETPGRDAPTFDRNEVKLIASPMQSLRAAAQLAEARGLQTLILGDAIEGEAREVGIAHAGIAKSCARHGTPCRLPAVLLSGGETTVTLGGECKAGGRGGRNQEFLLGLARGLAGEPGIHALACDTDGIDGTEPVAGAMIHPDTLTRAATAGGSLDESIAWHDSCFFFGVLGDLVITGPTRTNVNDFRAILIEGAPGSSWKITQ
ncbi:MAG: glycerate kinase [Pseudomonadota bacterium]|nr:glycerate kinase [Pseudomonadota bacterium]